MEIMETSVLNTNRKYKIFFYNLMSKSKRLYYNSRTIFTLGKKKEKITKSIYTLLTCILKKIQKNLNRYQISVNNYNFKRPKKKKNNQESHDISKLNLRTSPNLQILQYNNPTSRRISRPSSNDSSPRWS